MLTKMMVMVPMKMKMMMKAMMKMMVLMAVRPSNDGCGRRLTKKVVHCRSALLCTAVANTVYCTVVNKGSRLLCTAADLTYNTVAAAHSTYCTVQFAI